MSDDPKPTLKERIQAKFRFSLATWSACAVGVSLLLVAALAWCLYSLDSSRVAWGAYMTLGRAATLLVLWAVACAVTYLTVRVWMHDLPVTDTRIADGWNAGMQLFSKHGVGLSDLPCFVVLGCPSRYQQDRWCGELGHTPTPSQGPQAPAIDWHLTNERVLLFCRDVGVYGTLLQELAGKNRKSATDDSSADDSTLTASAKLPDTEQIDSGDTDEEPAVGADQLEDEKIEPPAELWAEGNSASSAGDVPSPSGATTTQATLTNRPSTTNEQVAQNNALRSLDRVHELVNDAQRIVPTSDNPSLVAESLTSMQTSECQESLTQLCNRLRSSRFPSCAINGTLVLVESEFLRNTTTTARNLGRAIRSDLEQLRRELGISCPTTVVVSDSQSSDDYVELFRRMTLSQPDCDELGIKFDSEELPGAEAMNSLADRLVNEVESQINGLFRAPDALSQPHNHRLVRVLIRCRRWRQSLRTLMVEACGSISDVSAGAAGTAAAPDRSIVSGLFVAAPGDSAVLRPHRQAVFRRMFAQQNHLDWTSSAKRQDGIQRRVVRALVMISVLLTITLLIQLIVAAT